MYATSNYSRTRLRRCGKGVYFRFQTLAGIVNELIDYVDGVWHAKCRNIR